MKFILLLCLAFTSAFCGAEQPAFSPKLYAFQNGLNSLSPKDGASLLKELGYAGIGSVYPKDLAKLKAEYDKAGLEIFSIYAGGKIHADNYQIEPHVIEAIQSLKGTNTLVELNLQRGTNPNDEQAIALVREIADKAKESGLKVVLYPHADFHIERLDHAVRIAKASGRDNVGVTFNLCHFLKVQPKDDFTAALRDAKPLLWSASTNGADADGKDWNTLIRPLDEGSFDQTSLLKTLREIDFQGPIGLQCFNIKIDSRQQLERSHKAWQKHLTASLLAAQTPRPPNILLIFADDIGYEVLNSYGGLDFKTPNLNRMAEQGMRFSRAHTSPVCTPSRVSLHTGLYVTRHGHADVLPVATGTDKKVDFLKFPTFAQQIRSNGYATSVTGKWQLATLQKHPDHIREAGFDSWCTWQIWNNGEKTDRHWNPTFNQNGKIREDIADRFGPDVLVDYVITQMRDAKNTNQPFLILHNELLPHWPVVETPDDRALKRPASLPNFVNYMDKLVGRLLDSVEELGIRDNTYVIFMGDNGTWEPDFINPKAGQPGENPHTRHTTAGPVNGGKFMLKDGGSHIPMLIWGPPSVPRGAVCDDLVDITDLFPTLCEITHTKIPTNLTIDGRSIAAQIHGKPGIPRHWVHTTLSEKHGGETLFDGNFRLFRSSGKLIDARNLPLEKPADMKDPEAIAAKDKLTAVFEKITPTGPRPPELFLPVQK